MNSIGMIALISCLLFGVVLKAQQSIADVIAPYKYEVKQLAIDDSTSMAYIDEGAGERTLIFIHGLATYLPSWNPVFDRFMNDYRCIAVDLPGYGRSSKAVYPATMSYYAEALVLLTEKLEVKNPVLVGHSMGAQIAVTTVLENPALFNDLVLLAPAGFETFTDQQAEWLKNVTTVDVVCNATDEQIRSNWKLNFYKMPESVEFMIEDRIRMKTAADFRVYGQAVVNGVHGMLNQPVFNRLKDLETRTLVVYGANDALIPSRYLNADLTTTQVAERGASLITNVQLSFIPECGHFVTFDKPTEINEIIDSFLTQ